MVSRSIVHGPWYQGDAWPGLFDRFYKLSKNVKTWTDLTNSTKVSKGTNYTVVTQYTV